MGFLIKWWLRWFGTGLKLSLLILCGAAAAGAIYLGASALEILYPAGLKAMDPQVKTPLAYGWKFIVHSVQLAVFSFVIVNAFPDFLGKELARLAEARAAADREQA